MMLGFEQNVLIVYKMSVELKVNAFPVEIITFLENVNSMSDLVKEP